MNSLQYLVGILIKASSQMNSYFSILKIILGTTSGQLQVFHLQLDRVRHSLILKGNSGSSVVTHLIRAI